MDKYKAIKDYVLGNYTRIKVKGGEIRFNRKCHLNSVHEAVKAKQKSIAMCVYLDTDNEPIIHFINITGKKYIDNTLGYWCHENQYYLVRTVDEDDFDSIGAIFQSYRAFLVKLTPWYIRLFKSIIV